MESSDTHARLVCLENGRGVPSATSFTHWPSAIGWEWIGLDRIGSDYITLVQIRSDIFL